MNPAEKPGRPPLYYGRERARDGVEMRGREEKER